MISGKFGKNIALEMIEFKGKMKKKIQPHQNPSVLNFYL